MSAIRILLPRPFLAMLLGLSALFAAGTAEAVTVASITLNAPVKTLNAGASETLTAVAKDGAGHAISGVAFTWSSSSTGALSITSKGVAKGIAPGVSTVKVTGGGKSASVAITVTAASITLTAETKMLKIGEQEPLTAVAKDTNGHVISGVKFTWGSSKSGIVSVSSRGMAKALDAGKSVITATGGGKSDTLTITVPTPSSIAGVAAKGAAITGATITLVDKKGATATAITDDGGSYTLDTTGLKPPFLVSVQVDETHVLYSVSADPSASSVVNISPLTDLIVRSWYSVQGVGIADAFTDPVTNPPPTPDQVQLISNVVVQVVSLWLQQNGVDTTGFSPINTPFIANGEGVDAVLDQTDINTDTGAITITDGTTNQDSTVTYGDGNVGVDTTTTNGDTTTSSNSGTIVATSADMQAALTGITTVLNAFANTVNTKGPANVKNTDLTPFLDKNLLNEGLDKAKFATATATEFRQYDSIAFAVLNIESLDVVNGVAKVNFLFNPTQGDVTGNEKVAFFFKRQSDGTWKFSGDGKVATLEAQAEMRVNQGANASANGPAINVDVRPIKGAYSEITVSGGGLFSGTGLNKQDQTDSETVLPDPTNLAGAFNIDRDAFFATSDILVDLVPAGTEFTLSLTPTGGGTPTQYTVKSNAFTTEPISITNLTGTALADANLGSTLHVVWTLPKTFGIFQVKMNALVFSANHQCEVEGPLLSTSATSTDLDFTDWTTCQGEDVIKVNLNLNVTGVSGERITVLYAFQDPAT